MDSVISLDGILLFTKKEIWLKNPFDEKIIQDLHGYDLDFSLQLASHGWEATVNKDLLLYHYSFLGKIDKNWLKANYLVLKKWRKALPLQTDDLMISRYSFLKADILLFIRYFKYQLKFFIR